MAQQIFQMRVRCYAPNMQRTSPQSLLTIFNVRDLHFLLNFVLHLTYFCNEMVSAIFSSFVAPMTIKDSKNSLVVLVE